MWFHINHCSRAPGPERTAQAIRQSPRQTEEESGVKAAEAQYPQQQEGKEATEGTPRLEQDEADQDVTEGEQIQEEYETLCEEQYEERPCIISVVLCRLDTADEE